MNPSQTHSRPPDASREPVDISQQSIAGEEDPGAALDMEGTATHQPARASGGTASAAPFAKVGAINPGDEAAPGTPGSGEDICRQCGGSGQINGGECPACGGTGKVTVGLGGG